MTARSDSRVQPMHAYKMAAALQAASSRAGGTRPILLRVESKAGHGAGKPLSKRIEEQVDLWSFMMWQLGMDEQTDHPWNSRRRGQGQSGQVR